MARFTFQVHVPNHPEPDTVTISDGSGWAGVELTEAQARWSAEESLTDTEDWPLGCTLGERVA